MRQLNRETLQGLWAAVPTPWDKNGQLDEGILVENCARLVAAGVDGVYTTDADGEFYAIELEEFARLAQTFASAMESSGADSAIGISWFSTKGVIDRMQIAMAAGIPNVHVALPLFIPLADDDVNRFFEDLATAVPGGRWIHYAHSRSQPVFTGNDYARLAAQFEENLIGTKIAAAFDVASLTEIMTNASMIAHQVGDPTLAMGAMLGAKGSCSYWVNVLPTWSRRYMDACQNGEWSKAVAYHTRLWQWELAHVVPLVRLGHRHAIVGKALRLLSGFLVEGSATRAPYYPIAAELQAQLKSEFDAYWAEELAEETLFRGGATRAAEKMTAVAEA
jgi:dihydrodipicolinate synthase/N-acetylneuraminate lyase